MALQHLMPKPLPSWGWAVVPAIMSLRDRLVAHTRFFWPIFFLIECQSVNSRFHCPPAFNGIPSSSWKLRDQWHYSNYSPWPQLPAYEEGTWTPHFTTDNTPPYYLPLNWLFHSYCLPASSRYWSLWPRAMNFSTSKSWKALPPSPCHWGAIVFIP